MDGTLIRLFLVILGFSIPVVLIQLLIYAFAKQRWIKYIFPGVALLGAVIAVLYGRFSPLEGFADLAYIILGIILFGVFLVSLITALVLDFIRNRKQKKISEQAGQE